MRIDGSIPIHIARAYGLPKSPAPVGATAPVAAPRAISALATSAAQEGTTTQGVESAGEKVSALVGATVRGPIDFSSSSAATGTGAFQLYTRAADKIEAAVAVQLGRAIDVKG